MSITLNELAERTQHVMFDFDGPVCSVFAGRPATGVAERLHNLIENAGHSQQYLGDMSSDPMQYLYVTRHLTPELSEQVWHQMEDEELEAISSAAPTAGGHEAIRACHSSGRLVTIVSNNSDRAINAYLELHDLAKYVDYVSARHIHDASLMKPSPHLPLMALRVVGCSGSQSIFVGDSVSDITAANGSGSYAVAYANREGKRASFEGLADVVIDSMTELARVLAQPPPNDGA